MKLSSIDHLVSTQIRNLNDLGFSYKSYELMELPVSQLVPTEEGDKQPIYLNSYLKNEKLPPIAVIPSSNGQYEIVDGNRRYKSLIAAGHKTVPVMILYGFSYWNSDR